MHSPPHVPDLLPRSRCALHPPMEAPPPPHPLPAQGIRSAQRPGGAPRHGSAAGAAAADGLRWGYTRSAGGFKAYGRMPGTPGLQPLTPPAGRCPRFACRRAAAVDPRVGDQRRCQHAQVCAGRADSWRQRGSGQRRRAGRGGCCHRGGQDRRCSALWRLHAPARYGRSRDSGRGGGGAGGALNGEAGGRKAAAAGTAG